MNTKGIIRWILPQIFNNNSNFQIQQHNKRKKCREELLCKNHLN